MMNKKRRIIIGILIAVPIIVLITFFVIGQIHMFRARSEVRQFAEETGISTTYDRDVKGKCEEDSAFFNEIYQLVLWERRTSDSLNEAFDVDPLEDKIEDKGFFGFEPKEELVRYYKEQQWKQMQKELSDETCSVIDKLYGDREVRCGIARDDMRGCYLGGGFYRVEWTVSNLKKGNDLMGYQAAIPYHDDSRSWIPMDIGYAMYPDRMMKGCEEDLAEAIESREIWKLEDRIKDARTFSNHYNVVPSNYWEAYDLKQALIQEKEKRKEEAAKEAAKKAEGSSNRNKRKYSYSYSYSDDYEIDPDDYDMDAYYADNWDEYDDVEDAAEGFLDDESEWDDY